MAQVVRYVEYDPDKIWENIMQVWSEAGGSVLYPGDEKEMLLRTFQNVTVNRLAAFDAGAKMHTLRFALEEYLDIKGEDNFCPRIEAAAATGSVKITIGATGQAGEIPAGTEITAEGGVYFRTTQGAAYNGYEQTVIVPIECTVPGGVGNGLKAGTQMQPVESLEYVRHMEIYQATAGGNDREEDEPYRERIRTAGPANVTTGPSDRYEAVAKAVSSDILDARALRISAGQVGVYLIVEDGADEESLKAQVLSALTTKSERPLTDLVVVETAEALTYQLSIRYQLEETAAGNVATQIAQAVEDYRKWQDYTLGQAFNPDYLVARMYQAGAMHVKVDGGSSFNGGAAQYTPILKRQRCTGSVQLTQDSKEA